MNLKFPVVFNPDFEEDKVIKRCGLYKLNFIFVHSTTRGFLRHIPMLLFQICFIVFNNLNLCVQMKIYEFVSISCNSEERMNTSL